MYMYIYIYIYIYTYLHIVYRTSLGREVSVSNKRNAFDVVLNGKVAISLSLYTMYIYMYV